jgi:hypothetical protein
MIFTARLLTLLAVIFLAGGCSNFHSLRPKAMGRRDAAPSEPLPAGALLPSHNLLVGRVLAVDLARGFAFVELAADAPANALSDGAELVSRTDALRETARLRASRIVRGRTLGTKILAGQPTPGDEVVFPAP